jgi:serine protease AprX
MRRLWVELLMEQSARVKEAMMSCKWMTNRRLTAGRCCLLMAVMVITLLAGCMPPAGAPAAQTATAAQPVQAAVLSQAATQPQSTLPLIVQKQGTSHAPEARVAALGGVVRRDLPLINGFSAELPAAALAQLAAEPAVRWISLDAPMQPAQADAAPQPAFVTWATAYGKAGRQGINKPGRLIDSPLGPIGTYGGSKQGHGSFAGFGAEMTDGYRIVKVEAVIVGYVEQPLRQPTLLASYVASDKVAEAALPGELFDAHVGLANAGPVYVDVTGSRQWQWADFSRGVELAVDFAGLNKHNSLSIDAVGLRVWTEPGEDSTGNPIVPNNDPNLTLHPERQVNVYNNVLGVEALWSTAPQLQGNHVGVAVVDSGVEKTGDLAHLTSVNVNFNSGYHDSRDRYGHGTFVAAVLAGIGKSSKGVHIGVAPRVDLVNVRVSDDQGMATVADVLAGLQWIVQNKAKYNIRVVNLSLNSSVADSYVTDPLCAAVEFLWVNGIVVVVSAGNNGTATLYPPANDPFVITVGATDDRGTVTTADDTVANFSGYGLTELGTPKPDVVAPGRNIIAYLPNNSELRMVIDHALNRVTGSYFRMSGTSVAAPMVTGVVALLLQDEPALTPDQVKARLVGTANHQWPGYDPTRAGAGYVNAYAAVNGAGLESANRGQPINRLLWDFLALNAVDGINWDTVDWNSVNWNSVNWNSVNWNSVNWNSVNWNSVNWNSVNWNSVNWNSDYWEEMEEMAGSSADTLPAVQRLFQLLAEDEAKGGAGDEAEDGADDEAESVNWLYLPAVNR